MRKFFTLLLMLCIALSSVAQKPQTKQSSRKPTTTAQKSKPAKKTQKTQKSQTSKKTQLQSRQQQLKKDIAANKKQKAELEQKVKKQLEEALILGTEINEQKRVIDTLQLGLDSIDRQIDDLNSQLVTLQGELRERQKRYASSVRYMYRNRRTQSRMRFVFSAKDINQMYRRTRFMNEYSTYQRAQGEAVKQKQTQVNRKREEMEQAKAAQAAMLTRQEKAQLTLQQQQDKKQQMAEEPKKQQRTVTALIDRQQKEEAEINEQIERLIAEEIAREQARLEAERKRREEQARLEAERKRKEEQARLETERQASKTQKPQKSRKSQKSKNSLQAQQPQQPQQSQQPPQSADPDTHLTGSFTKNKGRLPMPITGAYQIVREYGDNVVDGTRGVRLTSKGIYLKGQPGAQARCVFDGEVSKIFSTGKSYIVMVRHGRFISVYSDLANVSVSAGQKVSTSQALGQLGTSNTMQFQLRNWTQLLNPRLWLRR